MAGQTLPSSCFPGCTFWPCLHSRRDVHEQPFPPHTLISFSRVSEHAWGWGDGLHPEACPVGLLWNQGSTELQPLITLSAFRGQADSNTEGILHELPRGWWAFYYYMHLFLTKGNHVLAQADRIPESPILKNTNYMQKPQCRDSLESITHWFKCKWFQGLHFQMYHRKLL